MLTVPFAFGVPGSNPLLLSLLFAVLATPASAQLTWIKRSPKTSPSARGGHTMVYDSARDRIVVFGGWNATVGLSETWEWDSVTWRRVTPTVSPPTTGAHAMAYDARRGVTVVFGGNQSGRVSSSTWEYDGKTWRQRKPTTVPPKRREFSMTYDSRRGRVIMYGGYSGSREHEDTWAWDGKNWKLLSPTQRPSRRANSGLAYDVARDRVVLFGGSFFSPLAETWEFDGSTWARLSPSQSPSAREQMGFVYDPDRRRTVLFGGIHRFTRAHYADTWEWDGKRWLSATPCSNPEGRYWTTMAYDSRRKRIVLFGGQNDAKLFGDTWTLELGQGALRSDRCSVSVSNGGTVNFHLDAGTSHHGKVHVLLGSMNGTTPGLKLGNVVLPLNSGPYFDYTLSNPNGLIVPSIGFLVGGKAKATMTLPARMGLGLEGRVLHHAFVVLPFLPPLTFDFTSNAVPLKLLK